MQKIRVKRGNVVMYIEEKDVQRYLNMGYNVTDNAGNIVREAIPTDMGTLQKAYIENTEKIKTLENQIVELTKKLTETPAPKPAPKKRTTKTTNKEP